MNYRFDLDGGVTSWMTSRGPSVRITIDVTGEVVELLKTPEQVRAFEHALRRHLEEAIDEQNEAEYHKRS